MLEAARAIVHRIDDAPAAPLIFLWTGGEEAISPVSCVWDRSRDGACLSSQYSAHKTALGPRACKITSICNLNQDVTIAIQI